MLIRQMQADDLEQAAALEAQNFSRPWSKEAFADALEKDYYQYLVAVDEKSQRVFGMCGLIRTLEEGGITNVVVSENVRNQGIGYRMLTELMRRAEEEGVREYTLEVRKSNAPAIALYRKLGFVEEGIRPSFYDMPVEDAVIMRKLL
ncbi:MAG: ribosomal protein S18-alanine N-acetyltransferase [Lachnospiraceae bacterium]|nr:ribosomal protein S18-alanine N-acetyltransferase [Lachnospiraceae bacterium]